LHDKKGIIKFVHCVNGEIRSSRRQEQFNRVLKKYDIPYINPNPLTFNNGWFSGLIDSKGSIY